MLRGPDATEVRDRLRRFAEMTAMVERGGLIFADGEEPSPILRALRDGFMAAASANASRPDCARAALAALAGLPESMLPPRPPPPTDGSPVTAVSPMLKAASQGPVPGPARTFVSPETSDAALLRHLTTIERLAGAPPIAARSMATAAIAERDEALRHISPVDPPQTTPEAFCGRLRSVTAQLQTLQASDRRQAA
jgi:hypothetical protein